MSTVHNHRSAAGGAAGPGRAAAQADVAHGVRAQGATARGTYWLIHLALAALVGLLFLGAHADGSYWWSDAPRHALNGVFVKDLVAAAPWSDPSRYAYDYYAQYPALTILFYPPLFYAISAPFYALFGVSEGTALLVVALHYVAFAWGAWALFRCWLPAWPAAAAAAMLALLPEIAFWGRQVMLELPSLAFFIWSAALFTRYRHTGYQRPLLLYGAAALLLLAMYTKLTAGFLALAFAGTLLYERRAEALKDRHVWLAALVACIGLIPLLVLTVKFGQANIQSASGINDSLVSRRSLAGWLWYLRQFPGQLGWAMLAAGAAGLLAAAVPALRRRSPDGMAAPNQGDSVFWLLWLVAGYLFFSAIDLKEARHSVFILPPVVLAAALLLMRLPQPRWRGAALAALTAAVALQTVLMRPVAYVGGYAEAARLVAEKAPKDSSVLFSGYRDGSFVFNMRTHEERRDLTVVRADKMLLNVAVRRELGVKEHDLSEADILSQINALNVSYLVVQPGFWNDLAVMQRFERVLAAGQFEVVARIPTPNNVRAYEKELVIYRNKAPSGRRAGPRQLDLPIINRSINAGN
ncbi:glycosyltransferase family 39 protein [Massilia sp. Root351]|uniref:glycosyltransferase family 39 protein n=1 Tax=Massilia sp. Root351 TaxID=1736522 RepID=UPI0009E72276|nr:glycosyltransferase family 39 protein [Massilia sp. Root351]